MSKRIISVVLVLLLSLSLIACGGGTTPTTAGQPGDTKTAETKAEAPAAGSVVLKVYGAWPENNSNLIDYKKLVEKVKAKSNGSLVIEWGGGPEAIPSYQLVEALKNGVVDIAWTAHTYNVSHIPLLEGVKLLKADVLRKNGGFEYIDKLYQDTLGAHYLGALCPELPYNLYTKDEIKSLDDFKGKTIRATPAYQSFVESLGASATNMAPSEAYQALERGVIQGYGWPGVGIMDFGWQEVSKYMIFPAFYTVDTALVISGKAWDKLSAEQQQILKDVGLEIEQEAAEYYKKAVQDERTKLTDAGMVMIDLPEDIAKVYLEKANTEGWKALEEKVPDKVEELRKFLE